MACTRFTILMCGSTGAGKSTAGNIAGNIACGQPGAFKVGHGTDSETKRSEAIDFNIVGPGGIVYPCRLIDTIGFGDSELKPEKQFEGFSTFIDLAPGGLNVICYVQKWGRLKSDEQEAMHLVAEAFGAGQRTHTAVVITHCTKEDGFYEEEIKKSSAWSRVIDYFQGGRIYIDSQEQPEVARTKLHQLMLHIIQKNNSEKLSHAGFEEAVQYRLQKQQLINALPFDLRTGPQTILDELQQGKKSRSELEASIIQQQRVEARRQEQARNLKKAGEDLQDQIGQTANANQRAEEAKRKTGEAEEWARAEAQKSADLLTANQGLEGKLSQAKMQSERTIADNRRLAAEAAQAKADKERVEEKGGWQSHYCEMHSQ
mmetsp:Transcript_22999/g.34319  ORF Transcript_22999/g.34319 Transcript_22999/m.34319 type:complete len:373 (-) Transcript_22999:12-1130(-)